MSPSAIFKRLSALSVPLALLVIFLIHFLAAGFFPSDLVYEPPFLLPVLNFVFIALIPFGVAVFAARSYVGSGTLGLLFLGSGALSLAITGMTAAWFISYSDGINISVTIFNCGVFLSGVFHFAGTLLTLSDVPSLVKKNRRIFWVFSAYTGVILMMVLLILGTLKGLLPVFFASGKGTTFARQLILGSAVCAFTGSGLFLLGVYSQSKSKFIYWYSQGLLLIGIGLLAVLSAKSVGSVEGWIGRFTQYCGGLYILTAVVTLHSRRQSIEEELAEIFKNPRRHYQSLVESSLDGILLSYSENRILTANPKACEMLGYTENEIRKISVAGIIDDAKGVGSCWKERARTGRFRGELSFVRKDGSRFPVEISYSVFIDDQGRELSTLIFRDITDRKRAEEALRESEFLYRAIAENFPDGAIYIFDHDLRFRVADGKAMALLGYSRKELEGKTIWESTDKETCRILAQRYPRVLAGESLHFETLLKGNVFSSAYVPIRNESGKVIAGMVVSHDITKRKQDEKALKKAHDEMELKVRERTLELEWRNRELKDFANVTAHDLQEPLRKVQMFADLLITNATDDLSETNLAYLNKIHVAAGRMRSLIKGLLTYSRIDLNSQPFTRVDLNIILQEVVKDLDESIASAGGDVRIGNMPVIESDPTQMRQLFQNLISNALKYNNKEKPSIRIDLRMTNKAVDNGFCEILVQDNGIGFDEKYLDQIFKPFERLHTQQEYGGTGMGLSICRRIVERHYGSITARSDLGKGSTFIVKLPLEQSVNFKQ